MSSASYRPHNSHRDCRFSVFPHPRQSIVLLLLVAILSSIFPFSPAHANDLATQTGQWYFGLQAGAVIPDRARGVNDNGYAGLRIGKEIRPHWNLELNALESRHPGNHGRPRLTLRQFSLDLLRVFNRSHEFAPFIRAGVGLLQDEPRGEGAHTNMMGEAGLGLIVHLWASKTRRYSLDVRPELDVRWDSCHNCGQSMTDGIVGIGFDLNFGGQAASSPRLPLHASASPPQTLPPPTRPPPAKTTHHTSTARAQPEPHPSSTSHPPTLQQHTKSPKVLLTRVHFAINSARLKPDSRKFLAGVARGLKANPDVQVEIDGYTDSTGTASYNLALSTRRANAVRNFLVDHGAAGSQLTAKGYGETHPAATNLTAAGRQANRRTIMRITSDPRHIPVRKTLCGPTC